MARKRWDVLIELIKINNLKYGAEIGVKSGNNINRILAACPYFHWVAIDPWVQTENYARWPKSHFKIHENRFDQVLKKWPKNITKIKNFSVNAAPSIEDKSLDLVFIDGDHSYKGVFTDIEIWMPKIRKGGFISGHDYNNTNKYGDMFKGVDKAVHEFFGDNFTTHEDHVWLAKL